MDLLRKKKNYPKIAGQLVENGRGDFFLAQVEIPSPTVFQDDVKRDDLQRRFLASQRHNIVATLF